MNAGYNPTAPSINPNMPDWAKMTVEVDQLRSDAQYLHGSGNSLDHYYALCVSWKAAESAARDRSPDPMHYQPVTPFPTIPARLVEDYDNDKGFVTRYETDSSILPPSLDPYTAPVVVPPGISSTGAQKQQEMILNMLVQIIRDLALVKSKLGV